MSEGQSDKKICTYCGEDCAGQRRLKDEHGRYFHAACWELAKAERKDAHKQEAPATGQATEQESHDPYALAGSGAPIAPETESVTLEATPSAPAESAPFVEQGSKESPIATAGSEGYGLDSSAGAPAGQSTPSDSGETKPCPECGHGMPIDAISCPKCGYNTTTGQRPPRTFAEMAAAKVGDVNAGRRWPVVIGGVSTALGVLGLIAYVVGAISALSGEGEKDAFAWAHISVFGVLALVTLLLLAGGVGILRRRAVATVRIMLWAKLRIALALLIGAGVIIAALASEDIAERVGVLLGHEAESVQAGVIVTPMAIAAVLFCIWPIVILSWLPRPEIQRQISLWH